MGENAMNWRGKPVAHGEMCYCPCSALLRWRRRLFHSSFLGPSTEYTQLYRKLMAAVFRVVFMYFWNVSNLVSSLAHDPLEMGPEMGRLLDLISISALPRILVGSEPG